MKKILAVLLSTSMMLGTVSPVMARDNHDRNDRHDNHSNNRNWNPPRQFNHDRNDHKRHNNNDGWGVALGILGVGAALAIASNAQPVYAAPQPVYVQPQPVYVPVTVQRTVYEPRTVYSTVYQPQYRQVRYAEMY